MVRAVDRRVYLEGVEAVNLCVLSACYEKPELGMILAESCDCVSARLDLCAAVELNGIWPKSGDMRVGKLKAVLENTPRGFTHVLWADGFDTFLQEGPDEIMRRWALLGCPPLVLSAEKNCWPDEQYADRYPQVRGDYRFINAGTWLAHVGYLRDILTQMIEVEEPNDQRTWTAFYLDGLLPGAVIDSQRVIFQTAWGASEEELKYTRACVVHYNGGVWRNPLDTRYKDHWERVKAARGWV